MNPISSGAKSHSAPPGHHPQIPFTFVRPSKPTVAACAGITTISSTTVTDIETPPSSHNNEVFTSNDFLCQPSSIRSKKMRAVPAVSSKPPTRTAEPSCIPPLSAQLDRDAPEVEGAVVTPQPPTAPLPSKEGRTDNGPRTHHDVEKVVRHTNGGPSHHAPSNAAGHAGCGSGRNDHQPTSLHRDTFLTGGTLTGDTAASKVTDAALAVARPVQHRVTTPLSLMPRRGSGGEITATDGRVGDARTVVAVHQPQPRSLTSPLDARDCFIHGVSAPNLAPQLLSIHPSGPVDAPLPLELPTSAPRGGAAAVPEAMRVEDKPPTTTMPRTSSKPPRPSLSVFVPQEVLEPPPRRSDDAAGEQAVDASPPPTLTVTSSHRPTSTGQGVMPSAMVAPGPTGSNPCSPAPRTTSDADTQKRIMAHRQRQKDLQHQRQSEASQVYDLHKTEKRKTEQIKRGHFDQVRAELYWWNAQLHAEADALQRAKDGAMDGV